jgi:choline dehydrogenase-like flavoprotein
MWLSCSHFSLRERLKEPGADGFHCDVLVIGSGYGGAVAAARLAGRRPKAGGEPIRLFVIERGREWLPGRFPSRFAELPGHVRFGLQDGNRPRGALGGLFDVRIGDDVNVLVGNGLGGGSLINAAVMERPDSEVLPRVWAGVQPQEVEKAYEAAETMLQVRDEPRSPVRRSGKLQALDRLAAELGHSRDSAELVKLAINFRRDGSTPAGVKRGRCQSAGDCVLGCNRAAKRTLDVNYLALAWQRGAELYTGTLALRLRRLDTGWAVICCATEKPAGWTDDESRFELRAHRVIVAAGALGSTELLLRSASADLRFSRLLGGGFSANGDAIAAAVDLPYETHIVAQEDQAPSDRGIGPTISGIVRVPPKDGEPGFLVEEFGIPAPLRRVLAEITSTFGLLPRMLRGDRSDHRPDADIEDPLAAGDEALKRTMVYGLLGDDGAAGQIRLAQAGSADTPWDGGVKIDGSRLRAHPVFSAQDERLRKAHQTLGGLLVSNPAWRAAPPELAAIVEMKDGPLTTVHPLGGCAIGDNADSGVVDRHGRAFDPDSDQDPPVHDGLVVLDGSIVPGALGINPALTIAALAEHAVPKLAAAWGLAEQAARPAPAAVEQPRWRDDAVQQARPTKAGIAERLHGSLTLGGNPYRAVLDLTFDPIDDLRAWTQRLSRSVQCRPTAAVLRICPPEAHAAGGRPDGQEGARRRQVPQTARLTVLAAVMRRRRSGTLTRLWQVLRAWFMKVLCLRAGLRAGLRIGQKLALASSLGEQREIEYRFKVVEVASVDPDGAGPLKKDDELIGRKRIGGTPGTNFWRQLSMLEVHHRADGRDRRAGELEVDLAEFARRQHALLALTEQNDLPTALADTAGLLLLLLRTALKTHLLNVGLVGDQPDRTGTRLPGDLSGTTRSWHSPTPASSTVHLGLTRYEPAGSTAGADDRRANPVLLVHGLGAGGSTFAHESIQANLVQHLCSAGRTVWVAELRSSIAFDKSGLKGWSIEQIAEDIEPLIQFVHKHRGGKPVDVVAHCIGSAAFCCALLAKPQLARGIGRAVLSQVGPLLQLSPMNRLRGYVGGYLKHYLGVSMLDTRPADADGVRQQLVDLLIAGMPYPEADREIDRVVDLRHDFRRVRHRADAIFGQTFELRNIGDATLASLDALYGPVHVDTLAQTIHYAQRGLLADREGRNRLVSHEAVAEAFCFPVLLLHGRENRVFDWRGSLQSWELLRSVRGAALGGSHRRDRAGGALHLGADSPVQLWVRGGYGHQDCLIGKDAGKDVFPEIVKFLDAEFSSEQCDALRRMTPPPMTVAPPWIGPAIGNLRFVDGALRVSLQVHPAPQRQCTRAVAILGENPRRSDGQADGWTLWGLFVQRRTNAAAGATLASTSDAATTPPNASPLLDMGDWLREHALELRLASQRALGHRLLALMVHDDLPPGAQPMAGEPVVEFVQGDEDEELAALAKGVVAALAPDGTATAPPLSAGDIAAAAFCIGDHLPSAAIGAPAEEAASLTVAVASCQYPPGLIDAELAQGSYARLRKRLDEVRPPQWLLLLGDQVYVDETAGVFDGDPMRRDIDRPYELTRRMPALRDVWSRVPVLQLLDDHEVENDWQPRDPLSPAQNQALKAYARWQRCLNPPALPGTEQSYALDLGGWPVFVLDTRSRRALRKPGGARLATARMIGEPDWQSLYDWLLAAPRDRVKFIATASAMLPLERFATHLGLAERAGSDIGTGYPRTQIDLLRTIWLTRTEHVVLLAGDAHASLVATLHMEGGPAVHMVVSSGLYTPWPFANADPEADLVTRGTVTISDGRRWLTGQMQCHAVQRGHGFAVVRAEATTGAAPHIEVELHDVASAGDPQRVRLQ